MKTLRLSPVLMIGLSLASCATAPKPVEASAPATRAPAQAAQPSASTLAPSALDGFLAAPRGGCKEEDPVEAALKKKGEAATPDCATPAHQTVSPREAAVDAQ